MKRQLGQQYFDKGDCKTKTKKDITNNKGKCYLLFGCYLKKNQLLAINQFNISQSDTGIKVNVKNVIRTCLVFWNNFFCSLTNNYKVSGRKDKLFLE